MHAKKMVHFDLKPSNILLAADGTAKIGDMGLSQFLNQEYVTRTTSLGTFAWVAPEVILGMRCGLSADIYSLGVVLWWVVRAQRAQHGGSPVLAVVGRRCGSGGSRCGSGGA